MTILGEEWQYSQTGDAIVLGTFNSVFMAGTNAITGTTSDGIYYSADSGVTWTKATSATTAFATSTFNSVHLLADGHAIAGSTAGIYYSANSGVTWTLTISTSASTGSFNSVYMLADGHAIAGSTTGIYRSTDFGSTWTHPVLTGTFNSVYMLADGHAIAGSTVGIYYSIDFGASWTLTTSTSAATGSFSSVTMVGVKAIASSSSNTGIYYSIDSGSTWAHPVLTGSFNSVFFLSDGLHAIAGSSVNGGLFYSTDGGVTWGVGRVKYNNPCNSCNPCNPCNSCNPCAGIVSTSGSFSSVFMLSNGNAIAGFSFGFGLWYSTDYGLNWSQSFEVMGGFKSVFMLTSYAIAGSARGALLYSMDFNPYCPCNQCCVKDCSSRNCNNSKSPKLYTYSKGKTDKHKKKLAFKK